MIYYIFQLPNLLNPSKLLTPSKEYDFDPLPSMVMPVPGRREGFAYEIECMRQCLLKGKHSARTLSFSAKHDLLPHLHYKLCYQSILQFDSHLWQELGYVQSYRSCLSVKNVHVFIVMHML